MELVQELWETILETVVEPEEQKSLSGRLDENVSSCIFNKEVLTGGRTCFGIGAGACGERILEPVVEPEEQRSLIGGLQPVRSLELEREFALEECKWSWTVAGELGGMRGTEKQEATTCTYPVLRPSTEMIKIIAIIIWS